MDYVWELLGSEAARNIIISLIAMAFAYVKGLGAIKKHNLGRCVIALQSGVQEVYESFVKGMKNANVDGKLTDAEKLEVRDQAWNMAKDILAAEGIDLAKYYGPRIAKSIIEAMVKKSKHAGLAAKALLPAPELTDLPGPNQ